LYLKLILEEDCINVDWFVRMTLKIAGHPICVNKALLEELLPAGQQILSRVALASARLGCGLVGRR
jgi:hypothetical protein